MWIGWEVLTEGQYKTGMRRLSGDEKEVIEKVCTEFSDTAKDEVIDNEKAAKVHIARLLKTHLARNSIDADADQREYLAQAIYYVTYAYGPITPLLEDDGLEEIAVTGLGTPIYVFHREKGWLTTDVKFTSRESVVEIVNKMARKIGRRITLQMPRLNAVLPDGSRMHATIEPVSELELTIRKFRKSPITIRELIQNGYSYELLAFLWLVFQNDRNVIVCGNTAAGKTTTLNALFSFVPPNERIVLLEETPEIAVPHMHTVKLKTSRELHITMKDLIEDSLRMRPDRVIVGEVRAKDEILAMVESMSAGQARGCYATMHAQSAKELVSRMRYNEAMPSDIGTVDLVIVQRRMLRFGGSSKIKEVRKVMEVCELFENRGSIIIRHLYKYDPKKESSIAMPVRSKNIEDIAFANGMDYEDLDLEIKRRAKYLRNALSKSSDIAKVIGDYGAVG